MNERELIHHLMEIKERLSSMEAKLDAHVEQHRALRSNVTDLELRTDRAERKLIRAESSLKTLRWVGGILFVGLPGMAAAIVKVLGKS